MSKAADDLHHAVIMARDGLQTLAALLDANHTSQLDAGLIALIESIAAGLTHAGTAYEKADDASEVCSNGHP